MGKKRRSEGITVTGTGIAAAVPDVVDVELGAEATAPDVQQALDTAAAGLDSARSALADHGVAAADLQTAQTSTWTENREGGAQVTTARLTLRARVRDVDAAGECVRAALAAAGPVARLESMHVAVGDTEVLVRAAREAAFRDAHAVAEQLAALAGRRLGRVVDVLDGAPAGGGPRPMAMRADAMAAKIGVDPGTQEVSASVTVRWEFDSGASQPVQ